MLGLTSFAIAQPALDILGANAEFFVTHDATASQVVVFALAVYLVPAAVLVAVLLMLGLWRRSVGRAVLAAVGSVLAAMAVVQALPGGLRDRTVIYLGLFVILVATAAWAFVRTEVMLGFWRMMGVISPVVVVAFLFFSPASDIVLADEVQVSGVGAAGDEDVVFVVLDEFSLAAILDDDGALDPTKAPNLVRLSEMGTFYANATTVSAETARAVPSLLSGQIAEPGQLPLASQFPQNLFTILAPSHELMVDEIVSRLCPSSVCRDQDRWSAEQLYDDARIVYLHTLLPARWAASWLPDITTQWGGFGDGPLVAPTDDEVEPSYIRVEEEVADDQAARAESFIAELAEPHGGPRLAYTHLAVPHVPYTYLPDGRRYNGDRLDGLVDGLRSSDRALADLAEFRYQLQVAYVDGLIGRMLDALEQSGRLDQTMLVVVSDHGVVNRAGKRRRIPEAATVGDLAWVPMFVKYPARRQGERVDDPVQTIDLLPTVADALGVRLVRPADGRSLLDETRPVPERRLVGHPDLDIDVDGDLADAVARSRRVVPAGVAPEDAYGWGELRGHTGEPIDRFPVGEPTAGRLTPERLDLLADIDPDSTFVPALLRAEADGLAAGDHVAVFIDGRLAGSGPVVDAADRVLLMLDPATLLDGTNVLDAYLVTGGVLRSVDVARSLPYTVTFDGDEVRQVTGEDRGWSDLVPHPGSIDVRPGDAPADASLLVGWVAHCDADQPAARALILLHGTEVVPTHFDRLSRPDTPCLDGEHEVGFSLQVTPSLAERGDELRIVAVFDDGSFAVLE